MLVYSLSAYVVATANPAVVAAPSTRARIGAREVAISSVSRPSFTAAAVIKAPGAPDNAACAVLDLD